MTAEQLADLVIDFIDPDALGSAFQTAKWTPEESIAILTTLARDEDQKGNVRVAAVKLLSLIGKQALEAMGYIASLSQKRLGRDGAGNTTITTARTARVLQNSKRFSLEPETPEQEDPQNDPRKEISADGTYNDSLSSPGGDAPGDSSLLGDHRPPEASTSLLQDSEISPAGPSGE